ncbi:MAG: ABC transporter substrate-binding protein [Caldilineaceae bacterium]
MALVVLLVLAACTAPAAETGGGDASGAGDAASSDSGGGAAASNLPADAAPEQVLRIATGSTGAASFGFYPMAGGSDNQSWMPFLYVPPLYFDVDLNLQPGVLDSWKSNDDFTQWVFTVDPRAKWSDGSAITAGDVKATWEYMARPDSEHGRITQYAGNIQGFDQIRDGAAAEMSGLTVVDDQTLQVDLVNPDAVFHWRIATTHMNPVKLDGVTTETQQTFWLPENNPIVSGPYMLESFNPDSKEATLIPNPNWWMDDGPYLDRIEFRFQPEPETLAVLLQNDEVDVSLGSAPLFLKETYPDYFRPIKAFGFNSFWLSATGEPTNDINVRKALVLSVDGDAVFQAGFAEGNGIQAHQLIDPDLPCLETEMSWYPYDPEAAKEALAASSYGSAENLPKIRITPRGTDAVNNRALEAVMEFWRQNLGLTNVEFQQAPDGFGGDDEQAKINLSRDDIVTRFPDSATYMWVGVHSQGPVASGDMMRGYNNPEIDAMLEEALSLAADDPQRCELALEAQRKFMDDYQFLFIGIGDSTLNARDYVANYEKGPDVGVIAPWRIYMKQH